MLSKKVLIVGGTGQVGSGLAACLYKQGYEVRIISRNQQKIDSLQADYPEYLFYCVDCADPNACARLAQDIGEVDVFISSLGGFVESKDLLKADSEFIEQYFKSTLLTQYNLLKNFLRISNNFIVINGEAGLEVMPNYGLVSIFDAAQIMLTKVVNSENPDRKLSQLIICDKVSPQDLPIESVFAEVESLLRDYKKISAIGSRSGLLNLLERSN